MMNEKVEVQIGSRHLVVEMEGLTPVEINTLAKKVAERMTDLQSQNKALADTSKVTLLVALSFAADVERQRYANDPVHGSNIVGRITQLLAPRDGGTQFRAVLLRERSSTVRLLVPSALIDQACREFLAGSIIEVTGRMLFDGDGSSFNVTEISAHMPTLKNEERKCAKVVSVADKKETQ